MTVSGSRLNDRHGAVRNYICDQPCPASWDQNIDPAMHLHHLIDNFPVRILNQNDQILVELFFSETVLHCMDDRLIGIDCITAASEDH